MNVREAVDYLSTRGYPCSPGTVRALAKTKQLRCYRPGVTGKGPMTFTAEHLDSFLLRAEGGRAEDVPPKLAARKPARPSDSAAPRTPAPDWKKQLEAELSA